MSKNDKNISNGVGWNWRNKLCSSIETGRKTAKQKIIHRMH